MEGVAEYCTAFFVRTPPPDRELTKDGSERLVKAFLQGCRTLARREKTRDDVPEIDHATKVTCFGMCVLHVENLTKKGAWYRSMFPMAGAFNVHTDRFSCRLDAL